MTGTGYAPEGEFLVDGRAVRPGEQPDLAATLAAGVLCNGARLSREAGGLEIFGDPTESAILTAAAKAGLWKEDAGSGPASSSRRSRSTPSARR